MLLYVYSNTIFSGHAKKKKIVNGQTTFGNIEFMRLTIDKVLLFFLCMCLFSCKKKVDDDYRPEFIGYWQSNNGADWWYDINVDKDSYAIYTSHTNPNIGNNIGSTIKGTARANDKHFKIGRIYSFKIKEYPHTIDTTDSNIWIHQIVQNSTISKKANWTMTLEGPILHGGDGVYYKADY